MRMRNLLFISLGFMSIGVGLVGVVLPILPTTPFFILSSYCFVKGSDKFDSWFRNTKLFKNYAEDFIRDRSMTLQRKIKLMIISDTMLVFPLITVDNVYARVGIVSVIIAKYYYFIFVIKTTQ